MEENVKRRQSVYENVEKIAEKTARRRSMFENSNQSIKEIENEYMEEWNRRWGKENIDFVNVEYPEDYEKNIKIEKEQWVNGLRDLIEKAEKFEQQSEDIRVVEECELSLNQKVALQDIDCKISEIIKNSKSYLEGFEANAKMEELILNQMNREMNFVEKVCSLKDKYLN